MKLSFLILSSVLLEMTSVVIVALLVTPPSSSDCSDAGVDAALTGVTPFHSSPIEVILGLARIADMKGPVQPFFSLVEPIK